MLAYEDDNETKTNSFQYIMYASSMQLHLCQLNFQTNIKLYSIHFDSLLSVLILIRIPLALLFNTCAKPLKSWFVEYFTGILCKMI
jgi:hypothetical protein